MFANRRPLFVVRIGKIANERPVRAMNPVTRNAARFSTWKSTRFVTRFVTPATILHKGLR